MFNVVLASDDGYVHILSVCLVSILNFIPKILIKNANRIREQMYEDFFSKN